MMCLHSGFMVVCSILRYWYAGFIRLLIYTVSFLVGVCVIALLPNKLLTITAYGERSLYIYIWHGFFIKFIGLIGFIKVLDSVSIFSTFIVLLLLSIIITIILATKIISDMTDNLLFMPTRKLLLKNLNIE